MSNSEGSKFPSEDRQEGKFKIARWYNKDELPRWLSVLKNPPANAGDPGLIPGLGQSPGVGHGNPLQYSSLENSMGRGAWWSTVHEATKRWTRLSEPTVRGYRDN